MCSGILLQLWYVWYVCIYWLKLEAAVNGKVTVLWSEVYKKLLSPVTAKIEMCYA